ncbi:MAG: HlyD family efflux transporter periplasmic adaptor subunit [Thermoguttaceae bacterium]|nr:HlyD family efflux transporter periplasmic adaptor subunit [Thermoguttaceae bacterium]
MTKTIDWIARAFAVCALTAVFTGASFAQDGDESVVLDRSESTPAPVPTGARPSAYAPTTGTQNFDLSESSTASDGSIVVRNAKVEIPKGEGYEALISANGQGLLDELRLYDDSYDLSEELRTLSEHIAGEIAAEQSQTTNAGSTDLESKNTSKGVDPEQARQNAVQGVEKQFALLGRLGIAEKSESERPKLQRGMIVKKGQYLGRLQDDELKQEFVVALQELLVARKEADKTLEIDVAEAAAKVAQASYQRAATLNRTMPGSVSQEEVDEKYYDWIRAAKSIEKARYDWEVNKEKVKVSLARANATMVQIRNRKLRSPMDGFIDEIYQNEGQWVREGDQILHILRLDKVQVTGTIDAEKFAPEDIDGKTVVVSVKRPGADPVDLQGTVVYVRQIVESGHYYFYADVENQLIQSAETGKEYWLLNPGSLVTITIKTK